MGATLKAAMGAVVLLAVSGFSISPAPKWDPPTPATRACAMSKFAETDPTATDEIRAVLAQQCADFSKAEIAKVVNEGLSRALSAPIQSSPPTMQQQIDQLSSRVDELEQSK